MTARRRGQPGAGSPPPRLGRILPLEDEQDVAELIRYNLAKEGYEVTMASSGVDALRRAQELRPEAGDLEIDRYRFEVRLKGSGAATASSSPGRSTSTSLACAASSSPPRSPSRASRRSGAWGIASVIRDRHAFVTRCSWHRNMGGRRSERTTKEKLG